MNSFPEKFKIEVGEYCERLESGLLKLEQDAANQQIIGEIFRIMHTMKGSGGMFGFDLISEVTHDLESLFEIFRSGNQIVDQEVIVFTLKSIDRIKELLVENPTDEHQQIARELKAQTRQQIARFLNDSTVANDSFSAKAPVAELNPNSVTYYISFVPDSYRLRR